MEVDDPTLAQKSKFSDHPAAAPLRAEHNMIDNLPCTCYHKSEKYVDFVDADDIRP